MEKLRAAVNEFENFQNKMRERKLYDFDDMINWVIKAFDRKQRIAQPIPGTILIHFGG